MRGYVRLVAVLLAGPGLRAGNGLYLDFGGTVSLQAGLPVVGGSAQLAGARAALGYNHDFTPLYSFAFELGASKTRSVPAPFQGQPWRAGSDTLEYNVIHNFHLAPRFILIAGTGLVRNGRAAFPPAGGKDYLVSTQPAASLGVGYFPIRRLGVVVSYRHVFGTDAGDPGRPVQDALSAGLRLRF